MRRCSHIRNYFLCALTGVWMAVCAPSASAQEVAVRAAVEKEEVVVGESFLFQIQVEGNDAPAKPDMSGLTDFTCQDLGGQKNNSELMQIVNGRTSHVVERGYIFSYRLTPKKTGTLTIPPIEVAVGPQKLRSNAVQVKVGRPTESEDFKLRQTLSSKQCYAGEPVTLEVTWYIGKEPEGVEFTVPILENKAFSTHNAEIQTDPNKKYFRLPLAGGEAVAELGQGALDGKTYTTLSFRKVLIPKQSGRFDIPPATVACNTLVGYRKERRKASDDFFGSVFDDDFFARRKGVYKKSIAPSNPLTLQVLDLPETGRPKGFNGLVGRYRIEAAAKPTEVAVGDPITLTVTISGPDYLDNVELPPLHQQAALAKDFRIPTEMAAGKAEGGVKKFTQTIRATHPNVKEIPPIELPYFDAGEGKYAVARSLPIPIQVKGTRVLTVRDAEGREEPSAAKTELVAWTQGIAHNYEGVGILADQEYGPAQWLRSPAWAGMILLPPMAYLAILAATALIRHRTADPAAWQARRAYSELAKRLGALQKTSDAPDLSAAVLDALRQYLKSKLRLSAGAMTFADVKGALEERRLDADAIAALRRLFEECEAGHYAGGTAAEGSSTLVQRARDLVKGLDRRLG